MNGKAKSVVITGASTGIGRACALRLDRMGWRVFAGVRRPADGEALRAKASARLLPVELDVTDEASIGRAAGQAVEATGDEGLGGLVNNAGISVAGPLEFLPLEELRRQLEVNVTGQVAVTQAFLPLIRKGNGRIVFMGSISGRLATPFLGPYAASKFALEAIADALRVELRPWDIPVSIVEPGSIATPIWDKGQDAADELEQQLSPQGHELYDPAIAAVRQAARDAAARGVPPGRVARAVAHALTARRPKTRYLVGNDARLQLAMASLLPDRARDSMVSRVMKLPRKS
ncbi:MAG: SDR family oxidoreductase [Thermoflexaceae bacterium]|nr:SDR family oxidoreductase [Thermoflexaceae bacterium]